MNKEQQDYFKNARDRFTTEVDSFLIAYDNAVNENAELQKEVERLKESLRHCGSKLLDSTIKEAKEITTK
jgi:hypothetical protein